MSILQYYKRVSSTYPTPNGPLSRSIPSAAIASAFAYKRGSLSHNLQTFPHTRPCFFTWNMGGVKPEIKFWPYLNFNILIFVFFGLHEN